MNQQTRTHKGFGFVCPRRIYNACNEKKGSTPPHIPNRGKWNPAGNCHFSFFVNHKPKEY